MRMTNTPKRNTMHGRGNKWRFKDLTDSMIDDMA